MILAQDPHDLLGLGGFREGGEPAEIEEDDRHLAAVGLEGIVGSSADDQLGEVRREEALQPAQLVHHPVRPRVVDGGGGLVADDVQEDLVQLVEGVGLRALHREHTDQAVLDEQRERELALHVR